MGTAESKSGHDEAKMNNPNDKMSFSQKYRPKNNMANPLPISAIDETEPQNLHDPILILEDDLKPPCVSAYYVAVDNVSLYSSTPWKQAKKDQVLLIDVWNTHITTYPINVNRDRQDYLQPKYSKIESITFDWNDHNWPSTPDDVIGMLANLPEGFATRFEYGLGLKWEYRFLVQRISEIGGVRHIVFSKTEESRVVEDFYYFNLDDYHALRKSINNISRNYQRQALEDKLLLTYTNILRKHDPEKYPVKTKKIRPGSIYNIVNISGDRLKLDQKDQKSVIQLVDSNKAQLAKDQPAALLKLKTDIEHVTLGRLITTFEQMLSKSLTESHWQRFFKENSFVLNLAFSYPVLLIQDQAHVGGSSINGVGTKITDFLFANKFTGNLAVFEIKRPDSELLKSVEYRVNLFQNSKELSGSIAQVQDQKFQLQNNFAQLAYNSGWRDYHPFSVHCFVIIGRSPQDVHEKKSFEFTRHALKDVQVITFDELLDKLRLLYQMFTHEKDDQKPDVDDDQIPF